MALSNQSDIRTHEDALAAMDDRQLACRYGHMGFTPLLPGKLPKNVDASPAVGGGVLVEETCTVCTTIKAYITRRGTGIQDNTIRYVYPTWWVHVPRELIGGNVTKRHCKEALLDANMDALEKLASRKRVAALWVKS